MEETLEVWFAREILSHDALLTCFISRFWPHRDELSDLRQEAYARVYQAARKSKPREPRAFLFATARHLMTDRVRRERTVAIYPCADTEVFCLLVDELSPEQQASAASDLKHLLRALGRLPPRNREVLWRRRVQEQSQREVAEQLGISEKTVEKHLSVGTRKLTELLKDELRANAERTRVAREPNGSDDS